MRVETLAVCSFLILRLFLSLSLLLSFYIHDFRMFSLTRG
jgi:hypothetical protein